MFPSGRNKERTRRIRTGKKGEKKPGGQVRMALPVCRQGVTSTRVTQYCPMRFSGALSSGREMKATVGRVPQCGSLGGTRATPAPGRSRKEDGDGFELKFITLETGKRQLNTLTHAEVRLNSCNCINCSTVQPFYWGLIDPTMSAFSEISQFSKPSGGLL